MITGSRENVPKICSLGCTLLITTFYAVWRTGSEENCWTFSGDWRRRLFVWEEDQLADLIQAAGGALKNRNVEDRWSWSRGKSGGYSVKSAYAILSEQHIDENDRLDKLKIVWNNSVPSKIAAFTWKVLQDRILSILNLLKRGSYNTNYSKKCKICGLEDEDTKHIFFECSAAKSVWSRIFNWLGHGYRDSTT
ncbi:hypothetical protein ACS0TY_018757 [Phlomoides rotata]